MTGVITLISTLVILFWVGDGLEDESLEKRVLRDETGEALLIITFARNDRGEEEIKKCQLLDEKDEIDKILRSIPYSDVQQASNEEMQDTIDDCRAYATMISSGNEGPFEELKDGNRNGRVTEAPRTEETTQTGYSGVPVVLPGTKWCGAGDQAKQIQDLGFYEDTDQCCRAHDLCNDTLAPGETRNNLTNESTFTKLHCQCDDEFYECLEKVNSVVSNAIGNLYFNILKRGCYKYDHPDGKCKNYRSFLKITCKEYEKDTSAPKTWQWVSPKMYKTLPIPGPLTITVDFKK